MVVRRAVAFAVGAALYMAALGGVTLRLATLVQHGQGLAFYRNGDGILVNQVGVFAAVLVAMIAAPIVYLISQWIERRELR